jgi:organic hydroperoxide reductase OsmC/OhrA
MHGSRVHKPRNRPKPSAMKRKTTLRPPPLTLLDKYYGQETQTLYLTTVTVTGGEAGHGRASGVARSDDGQLSVDLRLPKALGGPGGGTSPEQLFAAGYAACFHGALSLLAAPAAIPSPGASVDVTGVFGRDPMDGLFVLTAHTLVHSARRRARRRRRVSPQHGTVLPLHQDGKARHGERRRARSVRRRQRIVIQPAVP